MKKLLALIGLLIAFIACSPENENETHNFQALLADSPSIKGKQEYLNSPYVTAGNRVYMVGHQNGTFPEIGWHIKGEMGGIWNHPIKLMDGFRAALRWEDEIVKLADAHTFINYPFGNELQYTLERKNLNISRLHFVPDDLEGISVQYKLENTGETTLNFEFEFTGYTDLRPTWLGEENNMIDGQDSAEFLDDLNLWLAKDELNSWYVAFGAENSISLNAVQENEYMGKGSANRLGHSLSIAPGSSETLTFTIAGSYNSKEAALQTYQEIQNNALQLLAAKKQRYQQLAKQSKLTLPDKKIEQTFEWLKYNCDWLVRNVPEVGTGITAGIPDYPWWFGVDSEYALKGYMAIGQSDVVHKTIELLDSVSNAVNGNGKIIHEMSTNGVVFNKGNINETPQYASLIWEIFQWNGDIEFLKKYFPTVKKGLQWLMEENDQNRNLFPDGFGMMEIHGLNSEMIDVASYTQRAFSDAAKMASVLEEKTLAKEYQQTADDLKANINKEFWSDEFDSYADFLGKDTQALHLIDDAIVRADTLNKPWAIEELEQTKKKILSNPSDKLRPFVVHHNWVVNTPMEMKIADKDKALKALNTAERFVNPFGVFVTGIDRDASAGSDDGSFSGSKVFSYTGAVMTLPTGVQAVAENNYNRPDKALDYLKRMTRTFSYALPGSMYEVSPDYGMIAQAWNIYSYAIPIVQQFFGIMPHGHLKKVVIKPQLPKEWDDASLENVLVADNEISVYYKSTPQAINIRVVQLNPDWTIELTPLKSEEGSYKILEGKAEQSETSTHQKFSSSSKVLEIQLDL
ncbi:trehalase family glycosidase [Muriicola sp. Z0-33]|uniref:alpha-L-rhamnosidase-related protein n=1 Tax=Muriicola sp. Z0-33 TaxID=2816957 RepID=UPI0022386A95|nr:trehalase family glycosidase [Muriicola sp. Z0-33]MCW5514964.1 glycogen debranching protein [Muriicola sp. Z0-33]